MMLHVENLKGVYEREHAELEDAKKLLSDHNLSGGSPSIRPISPPTANSLSASNRVRSVSVIHHSSG